MPHRSGAASTDLALDAFAVLGGDATIHVLCPGELTSAEDKALDRLAGSLPYLGRADSLCDARVERGWTPSSERLAVPLDLAEDTAEEPATVNLLAPHLPLDVTALTRRPAEVRAARLLYPPGSRQVPYVVPPHERRQPRARRSVRATTSAVTTVRLSIAGTPQPRARDLVTITDALRAACVKALTAIREGKPAISLLAGKDAAGQPLEGHQHASFLALTENEYVNGLAIWAPGGLSNDELQALTRLAGRTIGPPQGVPGPRDLHVRVTGHGGPELLPPSLTGPATSWISMTPFIPTHHRRRRQSTHEYLHTEIERELQHRKIATAATVTQTSRPEWALYTRCRGGGDG